MKSIEADSKRKTFPDQSDREKIPVLSVKKLGLEFPQYLKGLEETSLQVISDFTLSIGAGEIMGVVGASGSGKSLLADAILGILPDNARLSGNLFYKGENLSLDRQKELRGKEIFLIPQSIKCLNPLMKVGKQVRTVSTIKPVTTQEVVALLTKMGLPKGTENRYPYELSGGMARRVLIAMAMLCEAQLIIADEPTPGLDREMRDEVLREIKKLTTDYNKSVLFITHDIGAALKIADRIAVFNEGKTVEIAEIEQFCGRGERLKEAYTRALWNALPENGFQFTNVD